MLRTAGPIIAIALLLAGFGITFAYRAAHFTPSRTADSASTATASPLASDTVSPGDTPTVTAPSATQDPSGATSDQPTRIPSPTPDVFQVQSVIVTADPADNFTHSCSAEVEETFTMTITVDRNPTGETVTYNWEDVFGQGAKAHSSTVTFAPGELTKTVTFQQGFNAGSGDGSPQQDDAWVNYPDAWMWSQPAPITHATVAFTCVRQVTSLTLTPSISSWNAPCGNATPIDFTWTVTASPGPRMLVTFSPAQTSPGFSDWLAPNEFGAILTATNGPDQPTSQDSGVIQDSLVSSTQNGSYWLQVATISPVALTARATVVKNC